jgi:hypothetical protein
LVIGLWLKLRHFNSYGRWRQSAVEILLCDKFKYYIESGIFEHSSILLYDRSKSLRFWNGKCCIFSISHFIAVKCIISSFFIYSRTVEIFDLIMVTFI